jgi:hypothetical protein
VAWLAATAGLAWGRRRIRPQTPAYVKHPGDLQSFANRARDPVEGGAVFRIDVSEPTGRFFQSHYSGVPAKLVSWGHIEHPSKQDRFRHARRREATRLGLSHNGSEMLTWLGGGSVVAPRRGVIDQRAQRWPVLRLSRRHHQRQQVILRCMAVGAFAIGGIHTNARVFLALP